MRWQQTSQPDSLLTLDDVKQHLRIDGTTEDAYLTGLMIAATSHAEQAMECSLLTRTIVATYFSGEVLSIPRGPLVSVSSVQVNGSPVAESAYSIETYGTVDLLRYNNGTIQPHAAPATLVVTYEAGYGDQPEDVPADILQVIKAHIGLMYEQREVATDRTITSVPFISDFYRLRSREPGVG